MEGLETRSSIQERNVVAAPNSCGPARAFACRSFLAAALCAFALLLICSVCDFAPLLPTSSDEAFAADSAASSMASDETPTVRVGYFNNGGYLSKDESGNYTGFDIEYVYTMASYAGWHVQYVDFDTLADCLNALEAGDIDMVTDMTMTAERQSKFIFTNGVMSQSHISLMTRSNDDRYVPGDADTLAEATVAVLKDTLPETQYLHWCANNGYEPHVVECDTLDQRNAMLQSGQVDAMVAGTVIEDTRRIVDLASTDLYVMLNKDRSDLRAQVDRAMAALNLDDPTYTTELRLQYFPDSMSTTPAFTSSERAYLAQKGTVKVAVLGNDAPYCTEGADGTLSGILPDYYDHLSEIIGVPFQCVAYDSFDDECYALSSGAVDAISMVRSDVLEAASRNYILTSDFMQMNMVQITRAGVEKPSVVVTPERDVPVVLRALTSHGSNARLSALGSAQACLDAVAAGAADTAICSQISATWLINHNRMSDYVVTGFATDSWSVCAAMPQGGDGVVLRGIVNKALAVDEGSINQLIAGDTLAGSNDWVTALDRIPVAWIIAAAVVLLAVAVLALVSLYIIVRRRKHEALLAAQKAEADRREANLAAEERANAARHDFFSTISHDMRTPLNGIMGFTDLALDSDDFTAARGYLAKIRSSSVILKDLVDDTLDMSRIENGKTALHLEPVDNRELLMGVSVPMKALAEMKGVRYVEEYSSVKRRVVMADRMNTQKIFLNLISNAIKFTPEGGTVSGTATMDADDCIITIADTGCGIAPEFLPRVYDAFSQENPADAGTAGTGLGLSIVKSLVDAMGGTITVQSTKGEGTKFAVRLHFDEVTGPEAEAVLAAADERAKAGRAAKQPLLKLKGRKILVCEDNMMNMEIITNLLRKWGMEAVSAENGQVGLDLFARSAEGEFSAVLLDLRMPVLDGESTARAIRALDREDARRVLILAVSADAYPENVQRCKDAGMNGHVAKPVNADELRTALLRGLSE